jgi:hypothetical protein
LASFITRLARATSEARIRASTFALVSSEFATETICIATGRWAAMVSMLARIFSMS